MKGEVEVPVLNNAHVTYFYYPADSTSFIQAGKDPVVLGLSTLHLSCSIFNCFLLLRECLFYVRCSIYCEARWRSSVIFVPRKSCHVQWKKNYINKAHNFGFLWSCSLPNEPPFSTFSPRSCMLPSLNNVSIMLAAGQEEGELRALIQMAKGSERRDWRSLLGLSIESHHRDRFTWIT